MPPKRNAKTKQKENKYPELTTGQVEQLQEAFELFDNGKSGITILTHYLFFQCWFNF